jgi:hypothetical protein
MTSSLSEKDLAELRDDINAFYGISRIKRLHCPTNEEFLRESVSCHQPCIITGLLDEWRAMETWETTDGFLSEAPKEVAVNFTPNGRADAVTACDDSSGDLVFATPAEATIDTALFMDMLENPGHNDAVPYLSRQNDNLRELMPTLFESCSPSIPLADECFAPHGLEAANLWVGDSRSVTTTHKDFFENFYCVVRGEKEFTLFPPTDVMHLRSESFAPAAYEWIPSHYPPGSGGGGGGGDSPVGSRPGIVQQRPCKDDLRLVRAKEGAQKVRWIRTDPVDGAHYPPNGGIGGYNHPPGSDGDGGGGGGDHHDPSFSQQQQQQQQQQQLDRCSPITVQVSSGEVLYLPAMWLHRVASSQHQQLTISVNYWYDMRHDLRFVLYRMASLLFDKEEEKEGGEMVCSK